MHEVNLHITRGEIQHFLWQQICHHSQMYHVFFCVEYWENWSVIHLESLISVQICQNWRRPQQRPSWRYQSDPISAASTRWPGYRASVSDKNPHVEPGQTCFLHVSRSRHPCLGTWVFDWFHYIREGRPDKNRIVIRFVVWRHWLNFVVLKRCFVLSFVFF